MKGGLHTVSPRGLLLAALWLPLGLAGCHHQTQTVYAPSPPPLAAPSRTGEASRGSVSPPAEPSAPEGFFDDTAVRPVFTETGLATWYYARSRAGSDGVRYDVEAPTAAHKTLPLGSTVRVTNLQTGQWTYVRITDRGPFVPGRILDMSEVAAKAIGLYRPGVQQVRVEAFPHPGADPLGRWCVQTGPFQTEGDAVDLKSALVERYRGSRVSAFPGSTGFWVRIDPANRSKGDAATIADWIGTPDAQIHAYLVRVN